MVKRVRELECVECVAEGKLDPPVLKLDDNRLYIILEKDVQAHSRKTSSASTCL